MKKIMIAFAAIACAVVANAASINWGSGTIYIASDAAGTTGSGTSYKANGTTRAVTAYLFALTEVDYTSAMSTSVADLYTKYVVGGVSTAADPKKSGTTGAANITQTVADASGMNYGMVIFVDTANANLGSNDAFVKVGFGSANIEASGATSLSNLSTQQANWTAVPEPTSGLLLLLGMAGLALKRKHA